MDYVTGVFLLMEGIRDFSRKRISLWSCLVFGACSLGFSIITERAILEFIWAEIPGLLCLILSFCTREAIGYGDGILMCALGMLYDIEELLFILFVGSSFSGVVGLVLLVVFQKNGKQEIPFVPFLFIGWLIYQGTKIVSGGIL